MICVIFWQLIYLNGCCLHHIFHLPSFFFFYPFLTPSLHSTQPLLAVVKELSSWHQQCVCCWCVFWLIWSNCWVGTATWGCHKGTQAVRVRCDMWPWLSGRWWSPAVRVWENEAELMLLVSLGFAVTPALKSCYWTVTLIIATHPSQTVQGCKKIQHFNCKNSCHKK